VNAVVTLHGTGLAAATAVDFGADVTVHGFTAQGGGSRLLVTVSVADLAAAGDRTVTVTLPADTATGTIRCAFPGDLLPETQDLESSRNPAVVGINVFAAGGQYFMARTDLATARAGLEQAEVRARVAEQNAREVRVRYSEGLATALEQADALFPKRYDDLAGVILEEIREAGHQSASLTRQLLGFARRQTRMPRVLDLNEAAGASINMLGRLIGENIQLVWRPAHDLWSVRVDPTQIEQILANLATNARDAIDDSGEISIRTANVVLGDTDCADRTGILPGEFVMLEVGDNGCGMDVETQGRIFEPFYTTKGVGRGTGLGLATVDGIVRQNNGFIEVESVTGQGTRFRVFLPRFVDHGALDKAVAPLAAPVATSATILLVEDQLMVLRLTMRMLQKLGYTVLSAGTPEEAVRLAGEHANDIQLLLTDVVMPQMNGHDLAKELVASHPRLKYLLFSGYPLGTAPHQSTLGDGVHFLPKPFSQDQLGAKVREVLDGP